MNQALPAADPISPAPPSLEAADHAPLARAVRAVSGVTLLSRFAGLARNVIIARVFGDTMVGSAFAAAFQTPNMFRRLFGEGALSAAFIPTYTHALRHDEQAAAPGEPSRAGAIARLTLIVLGIVTTGLTVLIELALLGILLFMSHTPERELSLQLIMVMLPFMPLICGVAVLAGMLQVHGKFAWASSGPLVLNAFIVTVGLFFMIRGETGGHFTAFALAGATTFSGLTQLLFFFKLLQPHVRWSHDAAEARPLARAMLKRFIPVAIGMGTIQVNAFLDMLIAMWPIWVGPTLLGHTYPLDKASNAILFNTQQLYQFPLGVFGIAVATAIFPLLARYAHDDIDFTATLRRGLRLSFLIGLPASIGLVLIRNDLTAVLYGHGSTGFSVEGTARSAAVLLGFAPGVWAYSLNHVLTRAFYAKHDTRTPMYVSMAMVLLNLVLNVVLIWYFREAGLAWATSITATVQCGILMLLLRRRIGGRLPIDRAVVRGAARITIATALMAAAVVAALWLLGPRTTWWTQLLGVAVGAGVGGAVFAAAARLLRAEEFGWLLSLRRR